MEERERRRVVIGAPLPGPLPARSSRGEEGELDAAVSVERRGAFRIAFIGLNQLDDVQDCRQP